MKSNRLISFFTIFIVYIISTVVGFWLYKSLNINIWLKVLLSDIAATIVVFIFSLIFKMHQFMTLIGALHQ